MMIRLKDIIISFLWIVNLTYVYPAPKSKEPKRIDNREKRNVDGGDLPPLPLHTHSNNNQQGTNTHNAINGNGQNLNSDANENERARDYTGTGTRDYQYQYETGGGGAVGSGGYRVVPGGINSQASTDQGQQTVGGQTIFGNLGDTEFEFRTFLETDGGNHVSNDNTHGGTSTEENQGAHNSGSDRTTNSYYSGVNNAGGGTTQQDNLAGNSGSNQYDTVGDTNYPRNDGQQNHHQTGSSTRKPVRTGTQLGTDSRHNTNTVARSGTQSGYNTRNTYTGPRYYNTRTGTQVYTPYTGSGAGSQGNRRQYSGGRTTNYGGRIPISNQGGYNQGRYYRGRQQHVPNVGVINDDPTCPNNNLRIFINNMECTQAVDTLGSFICYNYERVSRECCEKCLPLKQRYNRGCEYGDRSYQCRNMESFDCYVERNREICCDTCRRYAIQRNNTVYGCEYGDLTPRCQSVRDRKHLCYLPENQRLCCVTCPSLEDQNTACRWGDQNPDICEPFTSGGAVRINCYQPAIRQLCCNTCTRLRTRISDNIAGCEYGDKPVRFSTVRGLLDCGNYVRFFGLEVCDISDVNTHCCHTCYRYRSARSRTHN